MIKHLVSTFLLLSFYPAMLFADNHETTRELGRSQAALAIQGEVVLTQAESMGIQQNSAGKAFAVYQNG